MIYMTHWAGLRVGEVASLKLKDIANRDGSIKSEIRLSSAQTKGHQSRVRSGSVDLNSLTPIDKCHGVGL